MKNKFKVKVIEWSDHSKFATDLEALLNDGFELKATSCGFVNSEKYDFCADYKAVLVKEIRPVDSNLHPAFSNLVNNIYPMTEV